MQSMIVNDQDSSEFAQTQLTEWKKERRRLSEQRLDITRDLDNAKKKIIALYQPVDTLLDRLIQDGDRKIIAYDEKVRAEAKEKQRKLDEEAEQLRQRDLKLAQKAEARGDEGKAEEFRDRAETRVAPVVQVQSAPLAGRSFTETWDYEMLDESKLAREFLMPDHNKIGRTVRSLHKDAEGHIGPGSIKITSNRSVRG